MASAVESVVHAVADCVQDRYVDAALGELAAEQLRRRLRAGGYADVPYDEALAGVLTTDLQTALPDLHLQVRWSDDERVPAQGSDWDDPKFLAEYWAREALDNHGFDRAQRLRGNVGLLVVRNVDEPEGTAAVVDAAFGFLARCAALILDLRRTTGGAPSGVAYFLRHLLPADTPLIEAVDRSGRVIERTATPTGTGPTFGPDMPVYALISRRTVSGCEELVYDLRAAGRATLVGETTIGAANPVDSYPVDPHVVVRVPTAVVRHLTTGGNWEGAGVAPDVECDAEDALEVAHRLSVDEVRRRILAGGLPFGEQLLPELAEVAGELNGRSGPR